jgi:hypothetical protein
VPTREELIELNSLQGVLTGDWSQAPYQYFYERHMNLLATLVRDAFRLQPSQTHTTQDGGNEILPSGEEQFDALRLNSGWRNPERNEIVGGAGTSRHMVGRAVDVGSLGVVGYEVDTTNRAELMWTLWNAAETLPASQQDGPRFRWLLEDADANNNPSNPGYSPFAADNGSRLVQAGTTTGSTPTEVANIDERGALRTDPEDGIPDVFNYASHLHSETKPTRTCTNGQMRWDCE